MRITRRNQIFQLRHTFIAQIRLKVQSLFLVSRLVKYFLASDKSRRLIWIPQFIFSVDLYLGAYIVEVAFTLGLNIFQILRYYIWLGKNYNDVVQSTIQDMSLFTCLFPLQLSLSELHWSFACLVWWYHAKFKTWISLFWPCILITIVYVNQY